MIEQKFLVQTPEAPRLDVFIKKRIKQLSRAQIQRTIKEGRVLVNGKAAKASLKLKEGDLVEFSYQESPRQTDIKPERIDFETVYEDDQILVVNKPPGLVVHPGAGVRSGTLVNGLICRYPEIAGVGSEVRPGIVHRLDKETSGLMVIARSPDAYLSLRQQFEDRTIKKTYLALAHGRFRAKKGIIDLPVGRHVHHREKMSVRTRKPRIAVTHFEVLEEFKETAFLALRPITGRTHQIRVHLSATGHPLAGDTRYGHSGQKQKEKYPRLFLHASKLSFVHPTKGEKLEFESPLPTELQIILDRERRQK